mgnify:CR=1 FL=1
MDEKISNLIDALVDLLDEDPEEFGIEDVDVIDVSDPTARGVAPMAFTGAIFQMADHFRFDAETFGFAIARLQHEFSEITGTVPVGKEVFDFLVGGEELTGELADTIDGMCSDDYKKRFVAEYRQLCIRLDKLKDLLERHEKGTLDFEPSCPTLLLAEQACHMENYKTVLQNRASIEHIDLGEEA